MNRRRSVKAALLGPMADGAGVDVEFVRPSQGTVVEIDLLEVLLVSQWSNERPPWTTGNPFFKIQLRDEVILEAQAQAETIEHARTFQPVVADVFDHGSRDYAGFFFGRTFGLSEGGHVKAVVWISILPDLVRVSSSVQGRFDICSARRG